jgi:putative FmdB family regulatory protein
MPLYEYQCTKCGQKTELLQRFADAPLAACPSCGAPVKKLISSPAFQFKGSGWYVTDYAKKGGGDKGDGDKGDKGDKGDASSASSADGGGGGATSGEGAKTGAGKSAGGGESKGGESKGSESKTESKSAARSETKPASGGAGS